MGKTMSVDEFLKESDAKIKKWKKEDIKNKGADANILVNKEDFEKAITMLSKVLRGSSYTSNKSEGASKP